MSVSIVIARLSNDHQYTNQLFKSSNKLLIFINYSIIRDGSILTPGLIVEETETVFM